MTNRNSWDTLVEDLIAEKRRLVETLGPDLRGGRYPPFQRPLTPKRYERAIDPLFNPEAGEAETTLAWDIIRRQLQDAERRAKAR